MKTLDDILRDMKNAEYEANENGNDDIELGHMHADRALISVVDYIIVTTDDEDLKVKLDEIVDTYINVRKWYA